MAQIPILVLLTVTLKTFEYLFKLFKDWYCTFWSSVMLLKDRVLYVGNVYIYAGLFAGGWRQRCKGYHRRSGSTSLAWAWPALQRQGSRARPPTILSTGTLVRSPSPTNSFKFSLHIPQNKYRTMFSYIMVSQKKFYWYIY